MFTGSNTSDSLRGIRWGPKNPGKVKALRREGPKRGAKELLRIIETPESLVNIETIRKYHADTIDKVEARCKRGARIRLDVQLRNVEIAQLDGRRELMLLEQF